MILVLLVVINMVDGRHEPVTKPHLSLVRMPFSETVISDEKGGALADDVFFSSDISEEERVSLNANIPILGLMVDAGGFTQRGGAVRVADTRVRTAAHVLLGYNKTSNEYSPLHINGLLLSNAATGQYCSAYMDAEGKATLLSLSGQRTIGKRANDIVTLNIDSRCAVGQVAPVRKPARGPVFLSGTHFDQHGDWLDTNNLIQDDITNNFGPVNSRQFQKGVLSFKKRDGQDVFRHSCNSLPGMSGSGLWQHAEDKWYLVGTHLEGDASGDVNYGSSKGIQQTDDSEL